jgi:hypothetical protein
MAKKKQFAGKKTKLAKLPLTQALASQVEGGATSTPPLSPIRRLPLTWDEVLVNSGEPLAAIFLFLVRELADLDSQLQSGSDPSVANSKSFLPQRVPGRTQLAHALCEARESLRDLKGVLSPP